MNCTAPYDPTSVIHFEVSLLSLAAALDQPTPIGTKEVSLGALSEAVRLREFAVRDDL